MIFNLTEVEAQKLLDQLQKRPFNKVVALLAKIQHQSQNQPGPQELGQMILGDRLGQAPPPPPEPAPVVAPAKKG